jgi:hypothetical protein
MGEKDNAEELAVEDMEPDLQAAYHLRIALETLEKYKPNDRSKIDRHWAVAITDLEKVIAYFDYWVFRGE